MSILVYFLGVIISAGVWFILIKLRQGGFYIPLPRKQDGNLLDPLNRGRINWNVLMIGWLVMAVLWPAGWAFLILFYLTVCAITLVVWLWQITIGNEKLARKIFNMKDN